VFFVTKFYTMLFTSRNNGFIKQPLGEGVFDECAGGILSGSFARVDAERRVSLLRAVAGLAV
jgi:hypothetical protein